MKTIIFGASGQDGTHLTGDIMRRDQDEVWELDIVGRAYGYKELYGLDLLLGTSDFCDIRDEFQVRNLIRRIQPDRIYHLAAESFVPESEVRPNFTYDTTIKGTHNILQAVQDYTPDCRVYFAATSEMFGNAPAPQSEETPMHPASPYALAKFTAYKMCQMFRRRGLWVSSGILENHESVLRPETFVTRKVSMAVARDKDLHLGNPDARRDWGHVKDAVRAMQFIIEHDEPDDFVIGTGTSHSVCELVDDCIEAASGLLGRYNGRVYWQTVSQLRPEDVMHLQGDITKAREVLGFEPEYGYDGLLKEMVAHDLELVRNEPR